MSTINSQTVVTGDIDNNVVDIYKKLMAASVGVDSVYIRAKETVTELMSATDMTKSERAVAITNMLAQITNSLSSQALTGAIALAKDNKESPYVLAKMSMDTLLTSRQADKVLKDIDMVTAQIAKTEADADALIINGWNVQAGMIANTGMVPNANTGITILADQTMDPLSASYQTIKATEAKVYEGWSNAIRASGTISYTIASGLPTFVVAGQDDGLIAAQTEVARRQYDAFDDNMRQHAVNSSAAMLGVMIGSEAFEDPLDYDKYILKWEAGMNYLTGAGAANKEIVV
jgi:hypothetical protein